MGLSLSLLVAAVPFFHPKPKHSNLWQWMGICVLWFFLSRSVLARLHILNVKKLGVWSLNPDPYMYYVMFLSIELNSYKLFFVIYFYESVSRIQNLCIYTIFYFYIIFSLNLLFDRTHFLIVFYKMFNSVRDFYSDNSNPRSS